MAEKIESLKGAALEKWQKLRNWKYFWYAVLIIFILVVSIFTFVQVRKYRAAQKLRNGEEDKKKDIDTGGSKEAPQFQGGNEWPLSVGSSGSKVEALQNLINLISPAAKLVPDGKFGNVTKGALVKIDPSLYPVSAEAFNKLAAMQPGSTGRPAGPGAAANDDFPLQEGSQGERVVALQKMINAINPGAKLAENGKFDHKTYLALLTYAGTKFYPVTFENYMAVNDLTKAKKFMGDDFHNYMAAVRSNPGSNQKQIGGRNCTKQWDVQSGQYVWNCGGGIIYNMHLQVV